MQAIVLAIPDWNGPKVDLDPHEQCSLLERIAMSGDRTAFRDLFEHYAPRIKSMLMKAGCDTATADDLVQDVMVRIWRKAAFYSSDRGSVASWVFTIARNARIDRLRNKSSQPYEDVYELDLPTAGTSAETNVLQAQHSERIAQAMAELPEDQQEVIRLAFMDDMAQSTIAEKLDLPLGTVKSRMRLAYGKMKLLLEDIR